MKISLGQLSTPALLLLCGVVAVTGCNVGENDVTASRENVAEEQRETTEVRREGEDRVREQESALADARHTVNRPDYDGDDRENAGEELDDAKQNVEDAKREAAKNLADEKRETEEVKAKADKKAREMKASKARDAYVEQMNAKLESIDKSTESMESKKDGLKGAALQKVETDIEIMQVHRENLADAISKVEAAELMDWESKKALADQACKRIDDQKKK